MRLSTRAKGTLVALLGGGLFAGLVSEQGCNRENEPEVVRRAAVAKYDWLQFGGDSRHGSNNTLETQITAQNVNGLIQLFKASVPQTVEGAPVVLTGVATSQGTRDVVFVTPRGGGVVAMDAYTGATIWSQQPSGVQITMSSPAIDPSRAFIYGSGIDGRIHKFAVGTGVETTSGGWPELATLKPSVEKDGTAIGIGTSGGTNYLYLGTGAYNGDGGEYQGHINTVNLGTGAQKVFNAMCSDQTVHFTLGGTPGCSSRGSGIWAKAGVTFDPATGKLFVVTGNGTFNAAGHQWGDSILALNPDGSGVNNGPIDSYTPSNFQSLQNTDKDLGSTNLLILPNNGSKYPHLGMQSGKDAQLRLINLDNMSGQGAPGKVAGEISTAPLATGGEVQNPCAAWINPADNITWVFVVSPTNGINASRLSVDGSGNPSLVNVWHTGGGGGGAAVANNVLYYASNNNLHALNPTTGAQLWNNTGIGGIHWQTPMVANGVLYVADNSSKLTAFSLTTAGGETPLSRTGWTASASDSTGGAPANALDGNTGTRFSTGKTLASGMYFQVDMAAAKTFDQVIMDSAGSTNDYVHGYQIVTSNDGTNFGSPIASGTGAAALVQANFPAQTARYIRIVATSAGTNWWSIAELNVYTGGSGGTGTAGTSGTGTGGTTGTGGSTGSGGSGGSGSGKKINAGGPAVAPFVADVDFTGGSTINHANAIDVSGVTNPAPVAVYQTARVGTFTYTIPGFTAGSNHLVRLHFAETFFDTIGSRVFNVSINGTQVLANFDIRAAAGAKNKAIVREFTQPANASGAYVIVFTKITDNSLVSGIEIP
jgi:F5/8 type C domain/Malectin domain/PQQ-like domain/PQQ enzyme repeat